MKAEEVKAEEASVVMALMCAAGCVALLGTRHNGLMSDADEEYWFVCGDCNGEKTVQVPVGMDENVTESAVCPGCEGTGLMEGDKDSDTERWTRVPN